MSPNTDKGQAASGGAGAGELLVRLVDELCQQSRRDIYLSADGEYYITYRGGGPYPRLLVEKLVEAGALREKYLGVAGCYVLARAQRAAPAQPRA